jgi:hypothetical protein
MMKIGGITVRKRCNVALNKNRTGAGAGTYQRLETNPKVWWGEPGGLQYT